MKLYTVIPKKMKRAGLVISTIFLLLMLVQPVKAQPGDPNGGDKPGVPISGIEILIAAGAALGLRSFFTGRKRNKE